MLPIQMPMTKLLLAGLLAAVALAAPAGASAASTSVQLSAPRSVRAGASMTATLTLTGAPARCQLRLVHSGRAVRTTPGANASRASLAWSWRVPSAARTATWTVKASCREASAQTGVRVLGTRRGPLTLAGPSIITRSTGVQLAAPSTPPTSGTGTDNGGGDQGLDLSTAYTCTSQGEDVAGPGCVISGDVLIEKGQCTYWAYMNRPDIINRSPVSVWDATHTFSTWAAKYWGQNAKAEGYPVDGTPQAGDIVVNSPPFDPTDPGAVGYVEAVNPDGSIVVSGMDVNGDPNVETDTVSAYWVQKGVTEGALFIHHHP